MTRLSAGAIILLLAVQVHAQGPTPEESLKKMKVADGFQVSLVASEPHVRNAVTMSFDDKGRVWVIQYLQYPTPAGLKPVQVDQFLRTKYDKIPEPPPKGPKGNDKITILFDADENGRFRQSKDFVTGLNLASGMALGHGGVFVVQPPYLLFYPDKNGDDVPDGDPEVLLTGFGMEDAHAFANSLQWGPDGWLYGAQGSTVTANVRGIEFQQGIWRYHPITKEFELFSEGGGNTWGLDFDRHGNAIAGTNFGGAACLHQVQGAYYIKNFGKHGALHNPYSFGFFDHIPYQGFKGGHVTCGGVLYTGDTFPKELHNQYIAGNLLSFAINWHQLERKGSTFTAKHGGELLSCSDGWFRPIDCLVGPDGAFYILDWCDTRANHVDPVDNWDRQRGRIWKLQAKSASPVANASGSAMSKLSSQQLIELLKHANLWYVREARRILAERRDPQVIPVLKSLIEKEKGQVALEALWALYVSGGFDDAFAQKLFEHPNEDVRTWTVRLLCDAKKVSPAIGNQLVELARKDASSTVRNQLACSAKRLPTVDGLAIVRELLRRNEDIDDPFIPLLVWWAIEDKAANRDQVLALLEKPDAWRLPMVEKYMAERIARRYLAEPSDANYATAAKLLALAPTPADVDRLIDGMAKALEGKHLTSVPAPLEKPLADLWQKKADDPTLLRLAVRLGSPAAYTRAIQRINDVKQPAAERASLIDTLSLIGKPEWLPVFGAIWDTSGPLVVRQAALAAYGRYTEPCIATNVLSSYAQLPPELKSRAQTLLCSRPGSALQFLQAVDAGKINAKEVPIDQLRPVVAYKDDALTKLVEKHWGKIAPQTAGEKRSRIVSVGGILRNGKGDPAAGKALFTKHCAVCHTFFGEGGKVGPDLTTADRKNRDFLIASTVDPSSVVRPEFVAYVASTKDGRVLTGLIVENNADAVTIVDAKAEKTMLPKSIIDELEPSPQSLMPEKLLDPFTDQELRDLFAYLQSETPIAGGQAGPSGQADAKKLKVLLISGSLEYKSDESFAELQKYLEANYPIQVLRAFRKTDTDIPGLDQLDQCDLAIFHTRRLTIDGEQLDRIKKYCTSGKPIIGLRTASHGFQKWLEMDKLVFGGNYMNHYKDGPLCEVKIAKKDHPILDGVKEFKSVGSLYKNPDIAKDCEVLLTGTIPGNTEPIAWARLHDKARVFYTSLGHPDDFKDENFKKMLVNAIFWTTQRPLPKK